MKLMITEQKKRLKEIKKSRLTPREGLRRQADRMEKNTREKLVL